MSRTEVREPLSRKRTETYTVFAAVPSTGDYTGELGAVRQGCAAFGRFTGCGIRVLVGEDAPSSDATTVREWIRARLLFGVDAVVLVHGPSWGCGWEDSFATELGLPRLLAFPTDRPRSALAGPDGTHVLAQGYFASPNELAELTTEWLTASCSEMRAVRERRGRGLDLTESFRQASLLAWEMLPHDRQAAIATELGWQPTLVSRVLTSDHEFAELHSSLVLLLATKLGVWDESCSTLRRGLSFEQERAFMQARATWKWSDAEASAVRELGVKRATEERALLAAGQPSRSRLRSRFGWRHLYRELCGLPPN
jgi:hypothetical protein